MNNLIKADNNLKLKAQWEHKTGQIMTNNVVSNQIFLTLAQVRDRMNTLRAQAENNLEQRRKRLAGLLNSEELHYQQQLLENLETPE